MDNNKKGFAPRKHFTRKASEGHAEKVDYSAKEYSTSRSFDSESPRPRRNFGDKPAFGKSPRGDKPYGNKSERPYGAKSDRPYGSRQGYGKPSFGGKPGTGKPGARKPFLKKNNAEEGMKAMLSRKPQIHGSDWNGEKSDSGEIQEVVRLNKFIANSGVCSRREADTMILGGVVTVNGEVVTELGTKINVLKDDVRFNGQRLKGEEKVYIVMNKPKGYVTTASDPHAERTVMDLIKGCPRRVFPVGRLDKNTTGVLMLTNDGEMAERLTHPSFNKKKIYQVVLDHPLTDDIRFNGQRLKGEEKVYIVMNKPKGYVTTASDPHAEKTVMDLLKGCPTRVFPVGRLDKNTTGVLMFTNDGEMAEQLTHPSYNKKKIYQVVLDSPLKEEDKEKLLEGVELSDGITKADELEYIDAHDHRQLGIEIHSGKNRIVRRMFEALGYEVRALDRVYFAGLTKKGLKKSDWRYLTEGEVNILKMGAYV